MSSVLKQTMSDEFKQVCEREGDPDLLDKIADERSDNRGRPARLAGGTQPSRNGIGADVLTVTSRKVEGYRFSLPTFNFQLATGEK
jgi:hypothetical protein